ncbi:MAG: hypothetical protein ACT4QB_23790 [Gammaproteobacteria bacterium]
MTRLRQKLGRAEQIIEARHVILYPPWFPVTALKVYPDGDAAPMYR